MLRVNIKILDRNKNMEKPTVGVILYHSNIKAIYKERWIQKCLDSIRAQTYQDFVVYELCYGDQEEQLWPGSLYEHKPLPNHIFALNHILDRAFAECDVVFNVNCDDAYHPQRFEKQLKAIREGYDLVSSSFQHMVCCEDKPESYHVFKRTDGADNYYQEMLMAHLDILAEGRKGHNVVSHPSCAYSRHFWLTHRYYDNVLGKEDFLLWQRAAKAGAKIKILPEILHYYRISSSQTGRLNRA